MGEEIAMVVWDHRMFPLVDVAADSPASSASLEAASDMNTDPDASFPLRTS